MDVSCASQLGAMMVLLTGSPSQGGHQYKRFSGTIAHPDLYQVRAHTIENKKPEKHVGG